MLQGPRNPFADLQAEELERVIFHFGGDSEEDLTREEMDELVRRLREIVIYREFYNEAFIRESSIVGYNSLMFTLVYTDGSTSQVSSTNPFL